MEPPFQHISNYKLFLRLGFGLLILLIALTGGSIVLLGSAIQEDIRLIQDNYTLSVRTIGQIETDLNVMRVLVRDLMLMEDADERHVQRRQVDSVALQISSLLPLAQAALIRPQEKEFFHPYITAFDQYFDAIHEVIDSAEAGNSRIANAILTTKVSPYRNRIADISTKLVSANIAAANDARLDIDRLQARFLLSALLIIGLSVGVSLLINRFVSDRFSGYIARITSAEQEKGKLLDLLTARQTRIERLMLDLTSVEENQRKRFSHELHDAIGHGLTAAKFYLDSARSELLVSAPASADLLDRAGRAIKDTLTEAKRISYELRPTLLDDVDFRAAIKQVITEFERRTQIKVRSEIALSAAPLDSIIEINLYRIIQESFTNIEKHARAKNVSLQIIGRDNGTIGVSINDDGIGFEPGKVIGNEIGPHLGLRNVVERCELIGGTVLIESHPNRGTEINIEIAPMRRDSWHD
jgi:signal transduction histidine kinase